MNASSRLGVANIEPGEGRVVFWLLLFSFCLGAGTIFVDTAANALFLSRWSAAYLPYVYLAAALLIPAAGLAFARFQRRRPLAMLLAITLWLLCLSTAGFWLALWFSSASWILFALLLWFRTLSTLTALVFWALVGQLFNVRQGKRLFGLVSTGELVARVIASFSASLLVSLVGTVNLLLIAAGSLMVGLVVFGVIRRSFAPALSAAPPAVSSSQQTPARARSGERRYITAVFITSALSLWAFSLVDFIFSAQAQDRFRSADQLAAFFGFLFAVMNIARLLARVFLGGWLLDRYGLKAGLLTLPLAIIALIVPVLAGTFAAGPAELLFWLVVTTKFVDAVLRVTVYKPAFQLLYQPLRSEQRLSVQVTTETIVEPVAVGLVGAVLLLIAGLGMLTMLSLAAAILLVAVCWSAAGLVVCRGYITALVAALAKRHLDGITLDLTDRTSLEAVRQGLDSPHAGTVIYAVNLLEHAEHPLFVTRLPGLLEHPAPEVRHDALQRIERLRLVPAREVVRRRVALESRPEVKSTALRTLAALSEGTELEEIQAYLDDQEQAVRRGALAALLRHGATQGAIEARQRLLKMVTDPRPDERIVAAHVLGEIKSHDYYQALLSLLHDPDIKVQLAALPAAGALNDSRLWPVILDALSVSRLRSAALQALVSAGQSALPAAEAALRDVHQSSQVRFRLARACAKLGEAGATTLLHYGLGCPNSALRDEIFGVLRGNGYRPDDETIPLIARQLKIEANQAALWFYVRSDIGDDEAVSLLLAALNAEAQRARDRVLALLQLIYDPNTITRVRDALGRSSTTQQAYALEVLENLLTQSEKEYVLPILDGRDLRQRPPGPGTIQAMIKRPREEWLRDLALGETHPASAWMRACALAAIGQLKLVRLSDIVVQALDAQEAIIRETAAWVLPQLGESTTETAKAGKGSTLMLSTIEKVMILKSVALFGETPDDVLAEVATIVTELDIDAGECIFNKGDLGKSMYIIVSGQVRVHDGNHTLNQLGERDVFGEMALLDPEPRIASVTATEEAHLFRLDQEPFYELIADRPEVARGIIRVLSGYVRARVRDIAALHTRVQELERTTTGAQPIIYDGRTNPAPTIT